MSFASSISNLLVHAVIFVIGCIVVVSSVYYLISGLIVGAFGALLGLIVIMFSLYDS
ncbi:hypothetical protein Mzhil_0882 [Methanosalsum zhilinae DSM 4017]|uniref:Uncharacterized protein n=1 Tax=Methanosalsum zhilinae (strain DSM 4017 / NBRC 107636 / OCM 62 / WeN5) TaxID=679901 RepID=F7XL87_METZD|nr:hypothetical protein [Methanosalsum zhilinae]AEH60744.1 hypothetical protein Mzhil_0882 [Methanosalsum zhilinae DSM 4017]